MTAARDTVALRGLSGIAMVNGASVLKAVNSGRIRDAGGALRSFFGALGVSVALDSVFGRVNSGGDIDIQTQTATATPSGGTAPYTYLWERTDVPGDPWTIQTPNAASTRFIGTQVPAGSQFTATFACTVTDSLGVEATSADVAAYATNISTTFGEGPLP